MSKQQLGWNMARRQARLLGGAVVVVLCLLAWPVMHRALVAHAAPEAQSFDLYLPLTLTGHKSVPGGDQPGGNPPGDDNPGGDNPGDDNPGDDNSGDDNPGDDNPGDDNPGDDNPGDDNPGGNPGDDKLLEIKGFFVDNQIETGSADIAIDPQGGVHMAFHFTQELNSGETNSMAYLYCAGPLEQCGDGDSDKWKGVSAFYGVYEVQLELTPDGRPRILVRANSVTYGGGSDYIYIECNQDCTDAENWNGDVVVSTAGTAVWDVTHQDMPQRYFALDPQGRPRFVYLDRNFIVEPDLYGGFYAWCDADCAIPANWQTANMTSGWNSEYASFEPLTYASLTFTAEGHPRVVGQMDPLDGETGIYYFECNADCGQLESWQRVRLSDRGQGQYLSWDLELDAAGRPRVAYYPADLPDETGEQLYYAACDNNCLDPANWQRVNLGLGKLEGHGPDLELDGQGRPRIAYTLHGEGGLGYSWCDGNCLAADGWQHQVIENRAMLYTEWPVPYPTHCDDGIWDGRTAVLTLDQGGNARIAYDTYYSARCWYDDQDGVYEPTPIFHIIQRAVRVIYFTQP